jgi:hypothetical protein
MNIFIKKFIYKKKNFIFKFKLEFRKHLFISDYSFFLGFILYQIL